MLVRGGVCIDAMERYLCVWEVNSSNCVTSVCENVGLWDRRVCVIVHRINAGVCTVCAYVISVIS